MGGFMFMLTYFLVFIAIEGIFPGYVDSSFVREGITKITIFKIPLQELLIAFVGGAYWSSIYEYARGYRIK